MADDAPFDNVCDSRASHCAFYSQQFFMTTFTPPPSDCFLVALLMAYGYMALALL